MFLNNHNFIRALPEHEPTCTYDNYLQIDTIFVKNIPSDTFSSGIYDTFLSDHKPIFFAIKPNTDIKNMVKTKLIKTHIK